MFNSLKGTLNEKSGEFVRVSTGGVEWDITMPLFDIDTLPEIGTIVRIFVWLYHREDQMRLYGFCDEERRAIFLELLKVEGVGPRQALKILSGISGEELEQALETEDVARLEMIPGLGKKTAQKMILTLKGKLVSREQKSPVAKAHEELISALVDMGYDRKEAIEAIDRAQRELERNESSSMSSEEKENAIFRQAIIILSTL